MKKILVMPVKNEDWILETSLACASLWADHIIVADQDSTDHSRDIYKRFRKVLMVENSAQFHSSDVRKLLLDAARGFEGNNAIFSFDADEIPTAHILQNDFWQKIDDLPVGSSIELQWVNLWRSPRQFRNDSSQWSNSWKHFGFIDDRKLVYDTLNVINDHTARVPGNTLENSYRFGFPKVLHYQFVDWQRLMSKQAHYRITEWLRRPQTFLEAIKINLKYFPSKDERGLQTSTIPEDWTSHYARQGVNVGSITQQEFTWFDREILLYFMEYGIGKFSLLDIWDIDWSRKQKLFDPSMKGGQIYDPRPVWVRLLHRFEPLLCQPFFISSYLKARKNFHAKA